MFEKSFEVLVKKVAPRRVSDEDGGSVHLTLSLSLEMNEEYLAQLGGEYLALYQARKEGEGSVSVPFTKAPLDLVYKDLSMEVFNLNKDEENKWTSRFLTPECEAKSLTLVRQKDDTTILDLNFKINVPPLKQKDRNYLIESVGESLRIGLSYTQTDLIPND